MGNVSLWTYTVILLCLWGITFGQRFPSNGYRNGPSKLRNFLGSKLIQRLSDHNVPQYETYEQQVPRNQVGPPPPQPLPPPPPQPFQGREVVPYEYQNQRIPPPPSPPQEQFMGPPQVQQPPQYMGPPQAHQPPQFMGPPQAQPPPQYMGPPQVQQPPQYMGPPQAHQPPQFMGPPQAQPPPQYMGHPQAQQPPQYMGPPQHHVNHQNMQGNVYTETITSSCPTCGTCSECEAANQDYSYQEETCQCPCSCSEGGSCSECSCSESPCSCREGERCSCCSQGDGGGDRGGGAGAGERYPSSSCREEPSYPDKDYNDRDPNRDPSYDDYSTSECPCCCDGSCGGGQDCQCSYPDDQVPPPPPVHQGGHRGYNPNENYMEGPPETHSQRHSENYMMGPPSYKQIPPREVQPRFQQYEEPMEPPPYAKMPRRRYMPPPETPPPVMHQRPGMTDLPEEPMHPVHMQEPPERLMQRPPPPEMSDRAMYHTEVSERTIHHRYHEAGPPMQQVEPMVQEITRVSDWRPPPRLPHPEPPVPMYRNYRGYGRKYRQPVKPAFFDGLSYSDGC